jgi:hypothetical protein
LAAKLGKPQSSPESGRRYSQHRNLEGYCQIALGRFTITRNHLIEEKSLKIKELEHVLIEKVFFGACPSLPAQTCLEHSLGSAEWYER